MLTCVWPVGYNSRRFRTKQNEQEPFSWWASSSRAYGARGAFAYLKKTTVQTEGRRLRGKAGPFFFCRHHKKEQKMDTIQIFDTTLRDGEQAPGYAMNLDEKVRMALQLETLGADAMEAGFAVASPGSL